MSDHVSVEINFSAENVIALATLKKKEREKVKGDRKVHLFTKKVCQVYIKNVTAFVKNNGNTKNIKHDMLANIKRFIIVYILPKIP